MSGVAGFVIVALALTVYATFATVLRWRDRRAERRADLLQLATTTDPDIAASILADLGMDGAETRLLKAQIAMLEVMYKSTDAMLRLETSHREKLDAELAMRPAIQVRKAIESRLP